MIKSIVFGLSLGVLATGAFAAPAALPVHPSEPATAVQVEPVKVLVSDIDEDRHMAELLMGSIDEDSRDAQMLIGDIDADRAMAEHLS